jgi:hypothetical protein
MRVPDHPLVDPLYLRERAEEFRARAGRVSDEVSKRLMLNLAESYEHLARRAEEGANAPGGAWRRLVGLRSGRRGGSADRNSFEIGNASDARGVLFDRGLFDQLSFME